MAVSTETMQVFEPATEQVLAELPRAGVEEADEAVARAKAAFPAWRDVTPGRPRQAPSPSRARDRGQGRGARPARGPERRQADLDARGEVGSVVDVFDYYAGAPERLLGSQIPVAGGVDVTFREPLGVVGLITPWNFPLPIASWKVGPALAPGTIVLKPLRSRRSRQSSWAGARGGDPRGRPERPQRPGPTVGERIVEHPDVAKVAFTGSTEIGRRVGEIASQSIKRVTLELGGKSANVVFADADLEKAAAAAPLAVFGNAGQDCCARSGSSSSAPRSSRSSRRSSAR